MYESLNAALLCEMFYSAAHNLEANKEIIDALNVFPVPDGDTGTNMSRTLVFATAELEKGEFKGAGAVLAAVAGATLRGARGNSGVILSQILRGIARAAEDREKISALELAAALQSGADTAYRAVMKPTEGTILTVMRQCAAAAGAAAQSGADIVGVFDNIITEGTLALQKTTSQLPQLQKAGVVDAGAKGLMCIFEGMHSRLKTGKTKMPKPVEVPAPAFLTSESAPEFMYCTEYIIKKKNYGITADKLRDKLNDMGDSLMVIDDVDIIKVHLHTNAPGAVLSEGLKLGALSDIKIDNMSEQHNDKTDPKTEADWAIIAVAAGAGISELFREIGAAAVIEGGQTMNPSTQEILSVVKSVRAKHIFLLPNNKNIILAAAQAKKLFEGGLSVIETQSIPGGIAAALAFDPELAAEENEKNMASAAGLVSSGLVTYAVRDSAAGKIKVKKGDILGIANGEIAVKGKDSGEVALKLIERLAGGGCNIITVLYGDDVSSEQGKALGAALEEKYPECDVVLHGGGQPVYSYIISVE